MRLSCPRLSWASTFCFVLSGTKDLDGRVSPGHDEEILDCVVALLLATTIVKQLLVT
jgi:hypothetical protein